MTPKTSVWTSATVLLDSVVCCRILKQALSSEQEEDTRVRLDVGSLIVLLSCVYVSQPPPFLSFLSVRRNDDRGWRTTDNTEYGAMTKRQGVNDLTDSLLNPTF